MNFLPANALPPSDGMIVPHAKGIVTAEIVQTPISDQKQLPERQAAGLGMPSCFPSGQLRSRAEREAPTSASALPSLAAPLRCPWSRSLHAWLPIARQAVRQTACSSSLPSASSSSSSVEESDFSHALMLKSSQSTSTEVLSSYNC